MSRYKRTMRARLADFYDHLDWWYDRNKEGLAGGFLLGVLVAAIAAELVLGLTG